MAWRRASFSGLRGTGGPLRREALAVVAVWKGRGVSFEAERRSSIGLLLCAAC